MDVQPHEKPQIRHAIGVTSAGKTDPGQLREHNEDNILVAPDLQLYVVADGMGGHTTGDVASALVVTSLRNFFEATRFESFEQQLRPEDRCLPREAQRLIASIHKANRDVFEISSSHERHKGMGSTIVGVHLQDNVAHIAHVGDSRCYLICDGSISQITRDHSLVNEARVLKPDITEAQLAKLPKNVVTRALGMKDSVAPDIVSLPVEPGDTLLLCSDGLSGMLTDDEILQGTGLTEDLGEACELLVTMANDAGGRDNISVVMIRFVSADEVEAPQSLRKGIVAPDSRRDKMPSGPDEIVVATTESFVVDPLSHLHDVMSHDESGAIAPSPACLRCGHELYEGNAFCTECGLRVIN